LEEKDTVCDVSYAPLDDSSNATLSSSARSSPIYFTGENFEPQDMTFNEKLAAY